MNRKPRGIGYLWPTTLLLFLAAPVGMAGTPEGPEISDPAGDTVGIIPGGLDLRASWVEWSGAGNLAVHMQIEGGFPAVPDCADRLGTLAAPVMDAYVHMRPVDAQGEVTTPESPAWFYPGNRAWVAAAIHARCPASTPPLPAAWLFTYGYSGEPHAHFQSLPNRNPDNQWATPGRIDGGIAVIEIPLAAFGFNGSNAAGASLTDTYSWSSVGDYGFDPDRVASSSWDYAPDSGFGMDFELGQIPEVPCVKEQTQLDSRGDVVGWRSPLPVPEGHDALDILSVGLANTGDGLEFTATLAADPRDEPDFAYYYWMGFRTSQGGKAPFYPEDFPTWALIATSTYDQARPVYHSDQPALDVAWEGARLAFTVPWSVLESMYGPDRSAEFGAPHLYSSGPYAMAEALIEDLDPGDAVETEGTKWYDSTFTPDSFVPVPSCAKLSVEPAAGTPETEVRSSAPAAGFLLAALAILALANRGRPPGLGGVARQRARFGPTASATWNEQCH